MKGIQGLVIAIVLGILGAGVNMFYLYGGRQIDTQGFVGIRDGKAVLRGKVLRSEHLVSVQIPRENVGNLDEFAVLWKDVNTVYGKKAMRHYKGGDLVLLEDLRTPPPHLNLKPGEVALCVTINPASTITSHILPGVTPVSFYLPKGRAGGATPESTSDSGWEWVGPFEVLTVGNRLGSMAVLSAEKIAQKQQNVLTLRAYLSEDGQPEAKFVELKEYVRRINNAPLDVMIHAERKDS